MRADFQLRLIVSIYLPVHYLNRKLYPLRLNIKPFILPCIFYLGAEFHLKLIATTYPPVYFASGSLFPVDILKSLHFPL